MARHKGSTLIGTPKRYIPPVSLFLYDGHALLNLVSSLATMVSEWVRQTFAIFKKNQYQAAWKCFVIFVGWWTNNILMLQWFLKGGIFGGGNYNCPQCLLKQYSVLWYETLYQVLGFYQEVNKIFAYTANKETSLLVYWGYQVEKGMCVLR